MADIGIGIERYGRAIFFLLGGEVAAVFDGDFIIGIAMQEKEWGFVCAGIGDGLSCVIWGGAEDFNDFWIGKRQEVIGACEADGAAKLACIVAFCFQISIIQGEHDGIIRTCGMACEKDIIWVGIVFADVLMRPGYSLGTVFEEGWVVYFSI